MKATLLVLNLGMQNPKVTKKTITVKNGGHPVLPIAAVFGVQRNTRAFDRLIDSWFSVMLLSHF